VAGGDVPLPPAPSGRLWERLPCVPSSFADIPTTQLALDVTEDVRSNDTYSRSQVVSPEGCPECVAGAVLEAIAVPPNGNKCQLNICAQSPLRSSIPMMTQSRAIKLAIREE
jgi:hypothetical protein